MDQRHALAGAAMTPEHAALAKPFNYLEAEPASDAPTSDNPSGLYCPDCRSVGSSAAVATNDLPLLTNSNTRVVIASFESTSLAESDPVRLGELVSCSAGGAVSVEFVGEVVSVLTVRIDPSLGWISVCQISCQERRSVSINLMRDNSGFLAMPMRAMSHCSEPEWCGGMRKMKPK